MPSTDTEPDIDDDDDDEDEDVNPYDDYTGPKQQRSESENKKLLGDALNDLSDEEAPKPVEDEPIEEPPKLTKAWPPPGYTEEPERPVSPVGEKRARPAGGASVLRKWPPASGEQVQEVKPEAKKTIVIPGKKKKWPPDPEPEPEVQPVEEPKPIKPPAPVEPEVKKEEEEEVKPQKFVALRPTKRENPTQTQSQSKENELAKIKLRKATDKSVGPS